MQSKVQRLVQDSLVVSAARWPNRPAVVDERSQMTYAQLLDAAARFARELQDRGLRRGDRVAIQVDNTVAWTIGMFGTLLAGGVLVCVHVQTKLDKLVYILDDCNASFLVIEGRLGATAVEAAAAASSVRAIYATQGAPDEARLTDVGAAIAGAPPTPRPVPTIPLDLAALIYTSGTTGRPKGVMLSHGALVFAAASIAEYLRLQPSDRILSALPLSFSYGLSQLLLTTRLGATLLLERSFSFPARTLARVRAQHATIFPAVPTVFATIAAMTTLDPLPSVRCLTNAAAGLPPALHEALRRVFPNAELYRMYGQTECVRVCYLEPELVERFPTSVGRAIPGTETLVLDSDGRPVGPGEVGILHVRGPHLMSGYWQTPELTARTLVSGPTPGERMLCTHDLFTVDEEGRLYFVDRTDDVIKTRGEKVSSVEVENVIHDIPGIRQAAVIGVPDDVLGQAIRAYVVLEDGCQLGARDVIRACRARLESHMVPREVEILGELPQTPSGKVRKKSLAENAALTP
jgi:long-chain acyl-CoA synthetase